MDSRDEPGMRLWEVALDVPRTPARTRLLDHFRQACERGLPAQTMAVRFVVVASSAAGYRCEVGVLRGGRQFNGHRRSSIFRFRRRVVEDTQRFTAVMLVPTGIGAEIGGHAGDAGPVVRMLANVCDTVIVHPNVVNASDLNEMPECALYVEGSVLTRLLMGTVGLQRVRSNRVLVVIDAHRDDVFTSAAVNAISAARATYGLSCSGVVLLERPVRMRTGFASSGRAVGEIEGMEGLCQLLEQRSGECEAVAMSSIIDVPYEFHQVYFDAAGSMVNPWGGVEAMLTHTLSAMYDLPTAHSPMLESREIADIDPGIVDPRMAAEAYSSTFLQCTLKGLRQSPRIVTDHDGMVRPEVLTAENVSCLVIPDGCLGLPTLAALEQGIPVIAVRENRNLMKNNLFRLPWASGQFYQVDNYWEAAGVISSMRAGIDPASVRRPLAETIVARHQPSGSASGGSTGDDTLTRGDGISATVVE